MKRIIITVVSTIIVVSIILLSNYIYLSSFIDVKVYKVRKARIISSVSSNGRVEEIDREEIHVETPARINKVMVDVGDQVRAGQELIELELGDLELQLKQARTRLEIEKLNYVNMLNGSNTRLIGEGEYVQEVWNEYPEYAGNTAEVYQKRIEIAQLEVEKLEQKLKQQPRILKSPIDGIVTAVNVRKGSITNSLEPVITISNVKNLQVVANVSEYYISKIKEGQKVEIRGEAFKNNCYNGIVKKISPIAKQLITGQNSETIVEIFVDVLNEDSELKPGYSAEIKIITEEKGDALLIPYEAITQDEDNQDMVYVVRNNRAYKRKIVTGAELETEIEVVKGIKEGEKVILNPSKEIRSGTKVRAFLDN
ncbi:MAG: efflux RND transporter periplasmic adaptor subunit [Clostridiaceae bacterium]|nr:efflux RND transporter periplasmic adaptor subunit [Clostridiaceae bacterium]